MTGGLPGYQAVGPLTQLERHHDGAHGWICLAGRDPTRGWRQHHYRLDDIAFALSMWFPDGTRTPDVYCSQHTFARPARSSAGVRELMALWVDLDTYHRGLTGIDAARRALRTLRADGLPRPHHVVVGRGIHVVWLIRPTPPAAMPVWRALQDRLLRALEAFSPDASASDPARVLRLGNTRNGKDGTPVVCYADMDLRRYDLRTLQRTILPPLPPKGTAASPPRAALLVRTPPAGTAARQATAASVSPRHNPHGFNAGSLMRSRIADLEHLVAMRDEHRGCRHAILHVYASCWLAAAGSPDAVREACLVLAGRLRPPLAENEVRSYLTTVLRTAQRRGGPRWWRTERIVRDLSISSEEQRSMSTLILCDEKRRRRHPRWRRDPLPARLEHLRQLQALGLPQKVIATAMGVTPARVSQLVRMVREAAGNGSLAVG